MPPPMIMMDFSAIFASLILGNAALFRQVYYSMSSSRPG
jgi:uncharacterized protein YggT (Ycf19 family)